MLLIVNDLSQPFIVTLERTKMSLIKQLRMKGLMIPNIFEQDFFDSNGDCEEFKSMVKRRIEELETKNLELQAKLVVCQESSQNRMKIIGKSNY